MGNISLQIPQSGLPNSTEDPKVASDFTTIQNLVNGNLDTGNLSATAGIVAGQLAAGAGKLAVTPVAASASAANNQLVVYAGVAAGTITLPTPTLNVSVGVIALGSTSGAQPVTITASSGVIYGVGASAVASVLLGTLGASMVLRADGTNWMIVGGQHDTGWVAPSFIAAGCAVSMALVARRQGDAVALRGSFVNNSGSTIGPGSALFSLPASVAPSGALIKVAAGLSDGSGSSQLSIPTNGIVNWPLNLLNGAAIMLNGVTYDAVIP